MYLINCLTATAQEMQNQLYNLHSESQSGNFPVNYLEFGNEFFMGAYSSWFPDSDPSTTFMPTIEAALRKARQLFPGVKIAVPFAYHFCNHPAANHHRSARFDAWNNGLRQFESLFDAVTIHEYSACTNSVEIPLYPTMQEQNMALAAWGDTAIDQQRMWIASFLSEAKEIWQTEWNYATWMGVPTVGSPSFADNSADVTNAAITGIFHASYGLKFVESYMHTNASLPYHTAANHHLFNQQVGQGWGTNCGYSDTSATGEFTGSMMNGAGQIFSHLSYVALYLSDTMHTVSPNSHCGTSPIEMYMGVFPMATNMNCLYATAHSNSCRQGALPVYQVINRCNVSVATHIDTSSAHSGTMRVSSYDSEQPGNWSPISDLDGNYAHPWTNGPLSPTVTTTAITPTATYGQRVTLPPISFSVIEFSQPGYSSSHLASGCPAIEF
jgi:hypothetical protein